MIANLNIHSFDFKYINLATKVVIISSIGDIAAHTNSCALISSFNFLTVKQASLIILMDTVDL